MMPLPPDLIQHAVIGILIQEHPFKGVYSAFSSSMPLHGAPPNPNLDHIALYLPENIPPSPSTLSISLANAASHRDPTRALRPTSPPEDEPHAFFPVRGLDDASSPSQCSISAHGPRNPNRHLVKRPLQCGGVAQYTPFNHRICARPTSAEGKKKDFEGLLKWRLCGFIRLQRRRRKHCEKMLNECLRCFALA
ncbi:hypothetical protein BDW02DRAFT_208253 [Decorospora gaudefroyi]|uniref:Uncharacterized protein n=1 Tax=Decorospora gaudefroyi TaxID=184978 RepID=A0A6A5KLY6_9PLEO|nr:hypothetical protein BDW02DRAFT_208253 [Decorospora gaudefroyi]